MALNPTLQKTKTKKKKKKKINGNRNSNKRFDIKMSEKIKMMTIRTTTAIRKKCALGTRKRRRRRRRMRQWRRQRELKGCSSVSSIVEKSWE
jgi:hypothetical protein